MIKLLVIFGAVWLLFRLGKVYLRKKLSDVQNTAEYRNYQNTKNKGRSRSEGETFISQKPQEKPSKTDGLGDFVDFEEVD